MYAGGREHVCAGFVLAGITDLLGVEDARLGPQARARATGQDHRPYLGPIFGHRICRVHGSLVAAMAIVMDSDSGGGGTNGAGSGGGKHCPSAYHP